MEMVAVDPKLFITCRLCLDEMGQYQIVPLVQEQIKYCFDINVEPFDGLPQLICVKCKDILSNYSTTKKIFHEKQDNLKKNLVTKKDTHVEPQQDTVSSTQTQQENTDVAPKTTFKRIISDPSSSSDSDTGKLYNIIKAKKPQELKKPLSWKSEYKKQIMCRMCNSHFANIRSFKAHYRSHESLRDKYKDMINQHCMVNMKKLDGKPNMTGLSDMVVHNSNKIVQSKGSYYVLYSNENNLQVDSNAANSDSTDELEVIPKRKARKKRRIASSSGSDTNTGSDVEANQNQCISIDDTSDSEVEDNNKEESNDSSATKKSIHANVDDQKTIRGIINTCVNNYLRKKDEMQIYKIECKLKHIVLSIGRKFISDKLNINCYGLLKYLEQKDLEVEWTTKTCLSKSVSDNFVRIFTKLKASKELDEGRWETVQSSEAPLTTTLDIAVPGPSTQHQETSKPIEPSVSGTSMLYHQLFNGDTTKLLNANPVANPKKLPKKMAQSHGSKSSKSKSKSKQNMLKDAQVSNSDVIDQENVPFRSNEEFCMPIITSTTSLADVPDTSQKDQNKSPSVESSQNVPRIKVKPPSELMSVQGLTNFIQEQAASNTTQVQTGVPPVTDPPQNALNICVPNMFPGMVMISSPVQVLQVPYVMSPNNYEPINAEVTNSATSSATTTAGEIKGDFVILDTVELPNTKTESPINYLKSLLLIHNLILLAPNATRLNYAQSFTCLIKFKVMFKQETKAQPVVLCLSLFSLRNMFCLKVKDIDIYKISANWQWEILQVFIGEVSDKILQHSKKVNQETYNNTNKFLCLLKSIKLKQ